MFENIILSFKGILSHKVRSFLTMLGIIIGVAAASCLWFTGLTLLISIFSNKFNTKVLKGINVICGIIILFYGGKLLFNLVLMMLR